MQIFIRILLFISIVALCLSKSYAAEEIGVVGAANPALKSKVAGGEERALKIGDPIFFGETITTNGEGNAQVIFKDKSTLTIAANSSITIDEFVYDPAKNSGDFGASITKGTFRFIGGALSKKKPAKFKTPVATIGIHGSAATFVVEFSRIKATGHSGNLRVINDQGDVFSEFGESSVITDGNSFSAIPVTDLSGFLENSFAMLSSSEGQSAGIEPNSKPTAAKAANSMTKIVKINSVVEAESGEETNNENSSNNESNSVEDSSTEREEGSDSSEGDSGSIDNQGNDSSGAGSNDTNSSSSDENSDETAYDTTILSEVINDIIDSGTNSSENSDNANQEEELNDNADAAVPEIVTEFTTSYNSSLANYVFGQESWTVANNIQTHSALTSGTIHSSSDSYITAENDHIIAKELFSLSKILGIDTNSGANPERDGLPAAFFDTVLGNEEILNTGPPAGATIWAGDPANFQNITATYEGELFGYELGRATGPNDYLIGGMDIAITFDDSEPDGYQIGGGWFADRFVGGVLDNPEYADDFYDGHALSGEFVTHGRFIPPGLEENPYIASGVASPDVPSIFFEVIIDIDTNGDGYSDGEISAGSGFGQLYGNRSTELANNIGGTIAISPGALYASQETDGAIATDTYGAVLGFRAKLTETVEQQ